MNNSSKMIFFLFTLIFFLFACSEQPPGDVDLIAQLEKERIEKDVFFKTSANSPIPDGRKEGFEGLAYFGINLKYRYQVQLSRYDQNETFQIITSSGVKRTAVKYGYFKFVMDDKDCILQVYKLLDIQSRYPGYLFIPFRDLTTGTASYPGGRYLDLQENDSQIYTLDFNLAYNPSCAYGKDGYNCPLPPAENTLDVAVLAGEKYPTFEAD